MKHLLKTYEHNGLTCDMRSSRKTFFPVMKEGKKIADIENNLLFTPDYKENSNEFNINILDSLDKETCNNLFEFLSQIINENEVDKICFSATRKFPRYRRSKTMEGALRKFADERFPLSRKEMFKHVLGKFTVIQFNGNEKLISKETYRELLKNNINVEHMDNHDLPIILLGNETVNTIGKLPYFYIDDFSKLNGVNLKIGSEGSRLLHFSVGNTEHKEKIVLPNIISEDNQKVEVYFIFEDAQTGEHLSLNKEDLDFRNFPNLSYLDLDHGMVSLKREIKNNHEPSI